MVNNIEYIINMLCECIIVYEAKWKVVILNMYGTLFRREKKTPKEEETGEKIRLYLTHAQTVP